LASLFGLTRLISLQRQHGAPDLQVPPSLSHLHGHPFRAICSPGMFCLLSFLIAHFEQLNLTHGVFSLVYETSKNEDDAWVQDVNMRYGCVHYRSSSFLQYWLGD
jgi:hypothetical protein